MIYKSITGSTVNVGSYVVSATGMYTDVRIPDLDALLGVSLELADAPVAEPIVEVTKRPVPSAPEPQTVTAEVVAE